MPKFDFEKIYKEATILHERNQQGGCSENNRFDYWLAKVAYTHGENYGYNYAVKEMDDYFGSE